jgi:hypothetical protein
MNEGASRKDWPLLFLSPFRGNVVPLFHFSLDK